MLPSEHDAADNAERRHSGRTVGWWRTVVLVAALLLGVTAVASSMSQSGSVDDTKTAAVAAQEGVRQARIAVAAQQANTARTECIRGISASLDEARWDLVFELFTVTSQADVARIGRAGQALPDVISLADHGGVIEHRRVEACPPPPKPASTVTTTTTGKVRP